MIRADLPLDSFVAREAVGGEFFNSLGYKRKFRELARRSAFGGRADIEWLPRRA